MVSAVPPAAASYLQKGANSTMKIAVSSDARTHLVDAILEDLGHRGHEVEYLGPEQEKEVDWPVVTLEAAERVAQGAADEAIVMCWTGTGATLAANKVPGVRAALCHDAETAKGARIWNHANVLGLSLRATPEAVAKEILNAWFETPFSDDEWNLCQMRRIREAEQRYGTLGK
jgi:ribose 5-phosphate isomerase B